MKLLLFCFVLLATLALAGCQSTGGRGGVGENDLGDQGYGHWQIHPDYPARLADPGPD